MTTINQREHRDSTRGNCDDLMDITVDDRPFKCRRSATGAAIMAASNSNAQNLLTQSVGGNPHAKKIGACDVVWLQGGESFYTHPQGWGLAASGEMS